MKMSNLKTLLIALIINQIMVEASYSQIGFFEELMSLSGIDPVASIQD
jgi:hypothetical protein